MKVKYRRVITCTAYGVEISCAGYSLKLAQFMARQRITHDSAVYQVHIQRTTDNGKHWLPVGSMTGSAFGVIWEEYGKGVYQ